MNQAPRKRKPWRIVVFLLAVAFIAFMWIKKEIQIKERCYSNALLY